MFGGLVTALDDTRLGMTYSLHSKYLRNPRSVRAFNAQRPQLTACQANVVRELEQRGIALTSFRELFGDDALWDRLRTEMSEFVSSRKVKETLEQSSVRKEVTGKDHLIRLFAPNQARLAADNIWLQVGLNPRIRDVANSYLGLWAKLNTVNLWYTIPQTGPRPRTSSQRWHRDPEDARMVKVFMYFSEVGQDGGPLQYISGSCPGGPYQHLWPYQPINPYAYPPQDELERIVSPREWVTCVGSPGTIVFCNTSGFHRGGYVTGDPRTLAFWTFVSPASLWPRQFTVDWARADAGLSDASEFALT